MFILAKNTFIKATLCNLSSRFSIWQTELVSWMLKIKNKTSNNWSVSDLSSVFSVPFQKKATLKKIHLQYNVFMNIFFVQYI